jgi:hypothetical protein
VEGKNIMDLAKYVKFPLVSILWFAIASCQANIATVPSNQTTVTYESSSEDFPNPERGFFVPFNPIGNNPVSPLQLSDLQKVRTQNMSLVRRIYLLSEFREKPLSQSFLEMISQDCETARQAGVKLIIRFSYNWLGGGADAPRERIISHLEQLQPILGENYDAIAYIHAGFIGYWGEWNRSTNKLLNTQDMRTILFKILSVLPTERMVALRYPKNKRDIYDNQNPLSPKEAFNGTYIARTGAQNECFLASIDDWGTYMSTAPKIVEIEKNFLNLDNRYVVQGGETCNGDRESQPYIGCANALKDLVRMRWSDLNANFDKEVLKVWEVQGCIAEIKRRLGYRFRLLNSVIPHTIKPGGSFSINFTIVNDGWASPYNPRRLEAILRNRQTRKEYYLPVPEDPRLWLPGTTKIVNITGGIPANMDPGVYEVLLNLPDPTKKLYKRAEYSIRFANVNIWEASTAYNSLQTSVIVGSKASGGDYSGKDFFRTR